jgi:hypothetical protein
MVPNELTLMTVDLCRSTCRSQGYIYSGVESGNECYCDNKLVSNGVIAIGCTMPCPGNSAQLCGGSDRINVYSL